MGWVIPFCSFPQVIKRDIHAVIELSVKIHLEVTQESWVKGLEIVPSFFFFNCPALKRIHLLENNLHMCFSSCEGTIYFPSTFMRIIWHIIRSKTHIKQNWQLSDLMMKAIIISVHAKSFILLLSHMLVKLR